MAAGCSFLFGRLLWIPRPDKMVITDGVISNDPALLTRFRRQPLKIRILGEDYEKSIGQVLLPYVFKFIPPEMIVNKRKGQTGVYNQISIKNVYDSQHPHVIDFLTYQQDSALHEGWDGHILICDEPPPRSHFIANKRGLIDHNGITLMMMTPLKEPWISNELVNSSDPSIRVVEMDSYANPHVPKSAIDDFAKNLNEDEIATRIHGKFLHLQGLVFKEFKKETHVIEPLAIIPHDWTCYVAIDTHPRTPQALLFVVVDNRNQIYCVHEIFQHGTPEEVAEWVIKYHKDTRKVYMAVMEPASSGDAARGDTTFMIIQRKLLAEGIQVTLGSKDLAGGILMMRQVLKTPNGRPALFVYNTLKELVFEFLNYVWKEMKRPDGRSESQKPSDERDHLIEDLRRLVQLPAKYIDPNMVSDYVRQANQGYRPSDPTSGY